MLKIVTYLTIIMKSYNVIEYYLPTVLTHVLQNQVTENSILCCLLSKRYERYKNLNNLYNNNIKTNGNW